MPVRKDGKTVLRCMRCGYETDASVSAREYRMGGEIAAEMRVKTTSIVSEAKQVFRSKEEIEQEREEYYKELFLELLKEEEYGGEEG